MSLRQVQEARESRFSRAKSIPLPELKGTSLEEQVHPYIVDDIRYSENAILLFCHNTVIKKLLPYKDQRYDLEDIQNRHKCLLEGLLWNRKFTNGVHLGLAPLYEWNLERRRIGLGKILPNPRLEDLKPKTEYVLVMRKLQKEYRLDYLLAGEASISQQCHVYMLTEYLSQMHKNLEMASSDSSCLRDWGSILQLKDKLVHNLDAVDFPVGAKNEILQSVHYSRLKSASFMLRKDLLPIFNRQEFCSYFEQRVCDGNIKRCHGDLKARNIWILPSDYAQDMRLREGVNFLDVIDFNPHYCNIDILSDFAMLAVDVQVRTSSKNLASYMIEDYLHQLGQIDKAARSVLQYYLVEKAFVGAYVNIMYDDLPDLGKAYLQAVYSNLARLKLSL